MGCCDSSTQLDGHGEIFGVGAGVVEGDAAGRRVASVALNAGAGDAGNFVGARNVLGICDLRMMNSSTTRQQSAGRWLLLLLVRLYQTFLSPFLGGACKFYPSCSRYAQEAIAVHGARRGAWLAMKRLGRCRPFTKGGFDPVPELDGTMEPGVSGAMLYWSEHRDADWLRSAGKERAQ
ncbi:MAG: membrane protein insertion efficiency factor YidD [Candidatus Acidiferrales bacterium]